MKNICVTLLLLVVVNSITAQNWEWLNTTGGSTNSWDLISTIDDNDNIIFGGVFTTDTMFVGNDTLVNESFPDPSIFLLKTNPTGAIVWSKSYTALYSGAIDLTGIDTDGFGNVYITGMFSGVETFIDFGNGIGVGTLDNTAFFVAKLTPMGNPLWAKSGGLKDSFSGSGMYGRSITVDNLGNSYVGVDFRGDTVIIDYLLEIPNSNYPNNNAIILKFAPNGSIVNSFTTGMETQEGTSLDMTPLGNIVYATQYTNTNISVGTITLANPTVGTQHGALIKLTPNLAVMWARTFGSEADDEFTDIGVDNLGNIYVSGVIQGTSMQFGSTTITNSNPFLGVIAKFDFQGNEISTIYTTSSTGNGMSFFTNIDIVNQNEIYVSSYYNFDNTSLGSSSLPAPSYFNSFVARIDSAGDALWMYNSAGSDTTSFLALEHDQAGNIYVGGWYKGSNISFGSNTALNTMSGPYDVFLAKLTNFCNLSLAFTPTSSTCGQNNGSAIVNVVGGSGTYEYQWTSGDSTATADSLSSGMYQVVVTDLATGCDASGIALISDIGGPDIAVVGVGTNNVTCNGGNDGQIFINLTGGQSPLSVSWSNGDTTLFLNNLTAGPYDVTVEDANGCVSTNSITIQEPDAYSLSYTTVDAGCGLANGSANVNVEGGVAPFTYLWSSGGTDTIETGMAVGDYSFMVTDVNGCSETILVMINEADGPIITIDSVLAASCLNGNGGSVYISVSGQSGPYTYQWSNGGGTNEDLIGVSPGNYAVMVTAGNGCSSMTYGPISEELPEIQEVCLVTVDTVTSFNKITWEKPVVGYLSHYNIYQEQTQAGVFNIVGSVLYDSLSEFIDSLSNPAIRSYRYKISVVDTCGVESELSWEHKTIHLVKSSFGGDNYLSWDNYEGFSYPSFLIWRYTDQTGWVNIYTLPSSLNSYTDIAPTGTNIDYFVEAVPNDVCTSTKAVDHNTTRSNRHTASEPNANSISEYNNIFVSLYPNPTTDLFRIELTNGLVNNWSVEVYDISGKSIQYNRRISSNNHIVDLNGVENGIYLVRIQMGNKMVFRKVIKQ